MTRDHPQYHPCLHLLAIERTGWRRWILGRWVYSSEQFRIDIQKRMKAYEHMCANCRFWDSTDGIDGYCQDADGRCSATDRWWLTNDSAAVVTGAEFGCVRFQPKPEEIDDKD